MLLVDPLGGLGNRLMALMSARILAEHVGCDIRMAWEIAPDHCASPIEALFEGICALPLAEMEQMADFHCSHRAPGPEPEIEARLRRGETVLMRSSCFVIPEGMEQEEFDARLYRQYAQLKPLPALVARVPALPEGTIGVHIRRCDHWRTTKYSPLALFFRVMDRHCRNEPATRFFLASDSPEVIRQVRHRYGQRICAPAGSTGRGVADTPSGLVDMLALAQTRVIYHGFMSSFAYTAHLLSRRPLHCVSVPGVPAGWHASPADARHDRLMEWSFAARGWQKRVLPDAPRAERLRAELLLLRTRLVCSDLYQRWPLRRMRRIG